MSIQRGRPTGGEDREPLTYVGFRADDETLEAIDKLIAHLKEGGARGPATQLRSEAIRRALRAVAETLKIGSGSLVLNEADWKQVMDEVAKPSPPTEHLKSILKRK